MACDFYLSTCISCFLCIWLTSPLFFCLELSLSGNSLCLYLLPSYWVFSILLNQSQPRIFTQCNQISHNTSEWLLEIPVAFWIRGSFTSWQQAFLVPYVCKLNIELEWIWLVNLNVSGSSDWLLKACRLREAHRQEKGLPCVAKGRASMWKVKFLVSCCFHEPVFLDFRSPAHLSGQGVWQNLGALSPARTCRHFCFSSAYGIGLACLCHLSLSHCFVSSQVRQGSY